MFDHKELKKIRRHLGFSLKEFAELLDVKYNTYKKIEMGERDLPEASRRKFKTLFLNRQQLKGTKLEGKIDYLRVRFKTLDYKTVIDKVLLLGEKQFSERKKGLYSYHYKIEFQNLNVYWSENDRHMGTLVEFSGAGCRQFEYYLQKEQKRDWKDFIQSCLEYARACTTSPEAAADFLKFTRLDVALDEFYNPAGNYPLPDLKERYDKGLIWTKARSFQLVDKSSGNQSQGKSFYFGSRNSPIFLNFYEKDLEQAGKLDVPVEFVRESYGFKNRYEVRLNDDAADQFVKEWATSYQFDVAARVVGLINDKLHVYKETRSGRQLDKDWYALMGSYDAFKFVMCPDVDEIGVREYRWIERSVARTLKRVLMLEEVTGVKKLAQLIQEAVLSEDDKKEFISLMEAEDYPDSYENLLRKAAL